VSVVAGLLDYESETLTLSAREADLVVHGILREPARAGVRRPALAGESCAVALTAPDRKVRHEFHELME